MTSSFFDRLLGTRPCRADEPAERTGLRVPEETVRRVLKQAGMGRRRPQPTSSRPDPGYAVKKTTSEDTRTPPNPAEVFGDAAACKCSWLPTRRALWSPRGQHIMSPTPGPPSTRSGRGTATHYAGETVVLCRRRKRRREVAERVRALVDRHPTGTISGTWDHAATHADDGVEAVVRAAAGRLVRLYLPT